MKPVVGIVGEGLLVKKPWGEQQVAATPMAVVAGVRAAGGQPVVLPPGAEPVDLRAVDALVLTGGVDLGVDPVRDRDEQTLAEAARRTGLPTLGLCRGLQALAVVTGGTLEKELGESHIVIPPGTHPLQTVLDATGPGVFGWLVRVAGHPRTSTSSVTCLSALYSPLTYRRTGTTTVPPARVTAS